MNSRRIYIILAAIALVVMLIAYLTPKEVNWRATYGKGDKVPYGSYVIYDRMKDIFPKAEIEKLETPFYNFADGNTDTASNYIAICDGLKADELDVEYMTSYVARGNNVFIAAYALPQKLEDTLGIELKNTVEMMERDSNGYTANFNDANIKTDKGYHFKHENFSYRIEDADYMRVGLFSTDSNSRHAVMRPRLTLGTNAKGMANFVKIPFGKGAFYIHSFPLAFTNYNILKGNNSEYVSKCLSYLPDQLTYWDEYYKPMRAEKAGTPLRFLLSVPAYQWALYTALLGMAIYMLFASKRLQRIIPIIKPNVNLSLEFTRTIGSLYYQQRDHRDIAVKKMTYLLEKIRQQYFIQTGMTDVVFREKLAQKSNVHIDTINKIFDLYDEEIRRKRFVTEEVLIAYNTALENFYSESGLINK